MTDETFLSQEKILAIPDELLPMPVLADSLRGLFSWGVRVHQKGSYSHFMWLISPGIVASQSCFWGIEKIEEFFPSYRLKFWYNPLWSSEDRSALLNLIEVDLHKPWYKRLYDIPAIIGQLIGWERTIQIPGLSICSDRAGYIKKVDARYDLKNPGPSEVDAWLTMFEPYQVYGRYMPD